MQLISLDKLKRITLGGNDDITKKFIALYIISEKYKIWLQDKQKEYDILYPLYDEEGNTIHYSDDKDKENYKPNFEEWLNNLDEDKQFSYNPTDEEIDDIFNNVLWRERRIAKYGNLNDQLDEIYHDYEGWRNRIAQIKKEIPKPE